MLRALQAAANRAFHRLFGAPPRRPESELTEREMDLARSIQAISLDQQNKTDLAKTQLKAVNLERLPPSLRSRVDGILAK